jgi:RNA polymerase sigma factor (sigma-70 family)
VELHEIVNRIREGETDEFAKLAGRYRDMAFGYALTLLDQEQMAEDAVQEALLIAYTRLDRLRQPQRFGAWLRGIVRHQCLRARRTNRQTVSWEQMEEIGSDAADPAHEALNQAVREQVWAAVAALPPAQQQVVRLHYADGLSQQEIATRLSLTVHAVNMRLHAARTRLRRRLQIMTEPTIETGNTGNPGRVQEAHGPVVTVQFTPGATPPLFSRLTADNRDSLCVVQHLGAGRVRAVAARTAAIWAPGQEILDTGGPYSEPLDPATVGQVVATWHRPAAPNHAGDADTSFTSLPSGIKTIEVFAPLTQGGSTGICTEWSLGVLVLLPELLQHLDREENRQTFFVFIPPLRDAVQWQEVTGEITPGSRSIEIVYLPVADPLALEFREGLQNLDTTLVLARRLAEQAIWPCLDPLACRSRRLDRLGAESEQANVVNTVRQLLRTYYTLQFSLGEEATHTLSQQEWQQVQRARKVLRFLSQPFFVAEPYTGKPGAFVTSDEALRGFAELVAGRYDVLPRDAFYMVGAAPRE